MVLFGALLFHVCSVREVASDLSQFMSLFNDLVKYTENEDDSQTAVLDRDLKNSVLSELLLFA